MPGATSNIFLRFIDSLISNYAMYFPIILLFILLFVKLVVYSAARAELGRPLERIGIEFCSIGFAFFSKSVFDGNSQFCQYFSPKSSLGSATLAITLILVLIFMLTVSLFQKYQREQEILRHITATTKNKMRQYGYLFATLVLGFLMVSLGMKLI